MNNMKTRFRVGDKVWDMMFQKWGIVTNTNGKRLPPHLDDPDYPIEVQFFNDNVDATLHTPVCYYTNEGYRKPYDKQPSLSFTKCSVFDGMFSQVRPDYNIEPIIMEPYTNVFPIDVLRDRLRYLKDPINYIPFKWEDRDVLRGKWIKHKDDPREYLITHIGSINHVPSIMISDIEMLIITFDCLFENYIFINGIPCGKLKE